MKLGGGGYKRGSSLGLTLMPFYAWCHPLKLAPCERKSRATCAILPVRLNPLVAVFCGACTCVSCEASFLIIFSTL